MRVTGLPEVLRTILCVLFHHTLHYQGDVPSGHDANRMCHELAPGLRHAVHSIRPRADGTLLTRPRVSYPHVHKNYPKIKKSNDEVSLDRNRGVLYVDQYVHWGLLRLPCKCLRSQVNLLAQLLWSVSATSEGMDCPRPTWSVEFFFLGGASTTMYMQLGVDTLLVRAALENVSYNRGTGLPTAYFTSVDILAGSCIDHYVYASGVEPLCSPGPSGKLLL